MPLAEIPKTVAFIGYGQITGITLALTIAGSVFLNRATDQMTKILPGKDRHSVQQYITGASGTFFNEVPSTAREEVLVAIVKSNSDIYWIVVAASGLSIILSLLMLRGKVQRQDQAKFGIK